MLPLLAHARLMDAGRAVGGLLDRVGLRMRTDYGEMARGHASLGDSKSRAAFIHTLRTIVEPGGQRVDARDRLYLADDLPLLLVWGERDGIIPAAHGVVAHELVPSSRLELFAGAGHFPQLDEPLRFVRILKDFVDQTTPAQSDAGRLGELLRRGRRAG